MTQIMSYQELDRTNVCNELIQGFQTDKRECQKKPKDERSSCISEVYDQYDAQLKEYFSCKAREEKKNNPPIGCLYRFFRVADLYSRLIPSGKDFVAIIPSLYPQNNLSNYQLASVDFNDNERLDFADFTQLQTKTLLAQSYLKEF